MSYITITLVSEGSSDAVLLPVIEWACLQVQPDLSVELSWADLRRLPNRPRTLAERLSRSVEIAPCEILCVHRDANGAGVEHRRREIDAAVRAASLGRPVVPVIPVRETEAWLLIDEQAIRMAAGKPNGRIPLALPRVQDIESVADPKQRLESALVAAGERTGRRRQQFRPSAALGQIVTNIEHHDRWLYLSAIQQLQADLASAIALLRL